MKLHHEKYGLHKVREHLEGKGVKVEYLLESVFVFMSEVSTLQTEVKRIAFQTRMSFSQQTNLAKQCSIETF